MSNCIDLGPPVIPQIPDILLPKISLCIPIPPIDLVCCKFEVYVPEADDAVAAANLAIAGATQILAAGITASVMTLNLTISKIQAKLNGITLALPKCPIDGQKVAI